MGGRFGSIQARSVKRTHKWVCHVVPAYPNVSPGPMNGSILLRWTRLSCHRFVANQVRLALFILAYNLGNLLRWLCLPRAGQALVVAKPPSQTYQDRGEASSPRPAAGVSASRGSSASGGVSTSAGAYRRAPCSTTVGSILGIIGGDEDSQGGAVRLDELKRVQTC